MNKGSEPMVSQIIKISPSYQTDYLTSSPHDIDRMIDVFHDRTYGWFLSYAEKLNKSKDTHCGFAVLQLLFHYFEMIEQYHRGIKTPTGESGNFFRAGVIKVFPTLSDAALDILWKNARCGLYHSGMTSSHFFIMDGMDAITMEGETVLVDRQKFTEKIADHFKMYVQKLRSLENVDLRQNFRQFWEEINTGKIYSS
ncbi:MAG: hypothetical protein V1908_02530 [Candidatus Peregrinibacteria bacterium]